MQSLGFNGGPTMNVHKQNKTGGPGNQRKARAEQARESRPFRLVCDSGQQTQASQHSGKRSSIPTRECEKYELETLDVWPWLCQPQGKPLTFPHGQSCPTAEAATCCSLRVQRAQPTIQCGRIPQLPGWRQILGFGSALWTGCRRARMP